MANEDKPAGIFIWPELSLCIPEWSLIIDERGHVQTQGISLKFKFDTVPVWLHLAYEHLIKAEEKRRELIHVWQLPDEKAKTRALNAEFYSAVQVCTASAIALDGFYGSIAPGAKIPEDLRRKWRENRTPRYGQVAETFRRAFRFSNHDAKETKRALQPVYSIRDQAVHPNADYHDPVYRPDLKVGVPWCFAQYSFDPARAVALVALSMITKLTRLPTRKDEIAEYCDLTQERIKPVVERWEARYGPLFPERQTPGPDQHE